MRLIGGLKMRRLKASEIECRVAQVTSSGCSLLLYKTARVDRAILDEAFGDLWQNDFKVIDGKMYGGIGIYNKELNQWLWRWDCGTESNQDAEKGQASDCFKRAGFKWGIGVELYTAPFIWYNCSTHKNQKGKYELDDKFIKFRVDEIGYADNGDINKLVIVDDKGNNVFTLGTKKKQEKTTKGTITSDDSAIYIAVANINEINTLKEYYEVNKGNVNNQKQFHEMVCMRLKVLKEAAEKFDEVVA
jgi:hypothetical protein